MGDGCSSTSQASSSCDYEQVEGDSEVRIIKWEPLRFGGATVGTKFLEFWAEMDLPMVHRNHS